MWNWLIRLFTKLSRFDIDLPSVDDNDDYHLRPSLCECVTMEEEEEEDEGNEQVDVEWREYVEMMNSKEEEKKE